MKKEICICAAIKVRMPISYLMFLGHRHCHCIAVMHEFLSYELSRKTIMGLDKIQGFVTSNNRFVDRDEGLKLQKEAGISSFRGKYQNQLYSEDLY